ncbi:hypothetical protein D3C72_1452090 [compost metagenome]
MQQQTSARLRHHAHDIVVENDGLLDVAVRARGHDRGANGRVLEEGDALDRFGRVLADVGGQRRGLAILRRRSGRDRRARHGRGRGRGCIATLGVFSLGTGGKRGS